MPVFSTPMPLPVCTSKSTASASGCATDMRLPVSTTEPGTLPELTSASCSTRIGSRTFFISSARLKFNTFFPFFNASSGDRSSLPAASRNTQYAFTCPALSCASS